MLRPEQTVAVNEVILAASEAASAYDDSAHILEREHDQPELCRLFLNLARERKDMVSELAGSIKKMGDVPSAPDPDRETARTAIRHIKAHVARSGPLALIRERARAEDRLAAHIAEAQAAENQAPESRAALARAAAAVKNAQRALGDARARLEP